MSQEQFEVQHQPDQSRYALIDQNGASGPISIGEEAYVDIAEAEPHERVFYHTEVSEDYSGQGLASVLVRQAVDQAITAGFRIVPVCPYVAKWFEKHSEYADHVTAVTPAHLRAVSAS